MPNDDQMDLFGGTRRPSIAPLELAPVAAEDHARAAKLRALAGDVRLGTMSWTYDGWIGVLYAKHTKKSHLSERGLTAYGRHPLLRTVEIDKTYYRLMNEAGYAAIAQQVPDDFRFVGKVLQDVTTARGRRTFTRGPAEATPADAAQASTWTSRFLDPSYTRDAIVEPFVRGLGPKAGPLVFQFSASGFGDPERFAETLHAFLQQLPRGPLYAVELRNEMLLTRDYAAALVDTGAVHAFNVWGPMPGVGLQALRIPPAARRVLVVRWLSRPGDTHETARERFLPFDKLVEEDIATRIDVATLVRSALGAGEEVFALVSNKGEGCGPESIRLLADAIATR